MNKSKIIYVFLFSINVIFCNGILSNNLEKSLNYSLGFITDNEDDISGNNIENIKARLYRVNFNVVFKGKYEFGYNYNYNESKINSYLIPEKGSINYIYFKYHFKEREKFPLNLAFLFDYGFSEFDFTTKIYGISFYKMFDLDPYPITSILSYNQIDTDVFSYSSISLGVMISLVVNNQDNSSNRDILWFYPHIDSILDEQVFGIDFGIYHPIK